jgi:hypothetical protein
LHKLEPTQVLKAAIVIDGSYSKETFYTKMGKDGRLTIPKLTLDLLKDELDDDEKLFDFVLEVDLEPADIPKLDPR